MLSERVSVADFESEHFASRLIERLRWAVGDPHEAERTRRASDTHERSVPNGSTAAQARGKRGVW